MKVTLLFALMACALWGGGCNNAGPPPARNEIAQALSQPEVFILDVRSASEFASGHVPGAVNVPVSQLSRVETILPNKEQQIIVHCAVGVRSGKATTALAEMGYTNVLDAKTPKAIADAMGEPLTK
jgi:phage shock protein E